MNDDVDEFRRHLDSDEGTKKASDLDQRWPDSPNRASIELLLLRLTDNPGTAPSLPGMIDLRRKFSAKNAGLVVGGFSH